MWLRRSKAPPRATGWREGCVYLTGTCVYLTGLQQDYGRIPAFPAVCDNSHLPTASPNSETAQTFPTSTPITSSDVPAAYLLPKQEQTAASLRCFRSKGDQFLLQPGLCPWFMLSQMGQTLTSTCREVSSIPFPSPQSFCRLQKPCCWSYCSIFCKGECIFLCKAQVRLHSNAHLPPRDSR